MNHPQHQELLRNELSVTAGPVAVNIAPGNMLRHAIIISAPPTSVIYIRFAAPAANGVGLALYPGQAPLYLTSAHVGHALMDSVSVISPGGSQQVNAIDIFCPCNLEGKYRG